MFLLTSAMRAVAFTPTASVKHRRMSARFYLVSLFILTNIRERSSIVKYLFIKFR